MTSSELTFISKSELAQKLKISGRWLAYYLNKKWKNEMKQIGYSRHQHLITPSQQRFILEKFVYTE